MIITRKGDTLTMTAETDKEREGLSLFEHLEFRELPDGNVIFGANLHGPNKPVLDLVETSIPFITALTSKGQ